MALTLRGTKGSALTHAELDNNFIFLKSRDIVSVNLTGSNNLVLTKDDSTTFSVNLSGVGGYNYWHIPAGKTLLVPDDAQSFVYGDLYVEGTIDLQTNAQLVVLNGNIILSGGTIVGSGTTYVVGLPTYDTKVSGLTYTNGTLTLTQNDSTSFNTIIPTVSGLTYVGSTLTLTQSDGNTLTTSISSGGTNKFVTTSAFTGSVLQTINHGLNTEDILIQIWDSSKNLIAGATTTINDPNNVDITVGSSDTYKIVIIG